MVSGLGGSSGNMIILVWQIWIISVLVNLIRTTSLVLYHLFHRCPLFVVVADLVVEAFCVHSGGGCLPVCCFDGGGGYLW